MNTNKELAMLGRRSDTKPQLQNSRTPYRMTKAYITTICNNEMRNALIEENICSVPQNSHIKRPPLGVGGVRACVERWSAFRWSVQNVAPSRCSHGCRKGFWHCLSGWFNLVFPALKQSQNIIHYIKLKDRKCLLFERFSWTIVL